MEQAHTPGPWCIVGDNSTATVVRTGDGIATHIAKLHEQWICDEHGGSVLANARLIAAAPELLQALETLRAQLHEHVKLNVRKHYSLMVADAAAGSAIAKARAE